MQKIRAGFRPKTAQHRGGQTPLVEPDVHLELFQKQATEYVCKYLPFSAPTATIEVDEDPLNEKISSSSSSSSDGSSQPNDEVEVEDKSATLAQTHADSEWADEVVLAKHRRVTHAMILQNSEASDTPRYLDKHWRPACGSHMSHDDTSFLSEWSYNL